MLTFCQIKLPALATCIVCQERFTSKYLTKTYMVSNSFNGSLTPGTIYVLWCIRLEAACQQLNEGTFFCGYMVMKWCNKLTTLTVCSRILHNHQVTTLKRAYSPDNQAQLPVHAHGLLMSEIIPQFSCRQYHSRPTPTRLRLRFNGYLAAKESHNCCVMQTKCQRVKDDNNIIYRRSITYMHKDKHIMI